MLLLIIICFFQLALRILGGLNMIRGFFIFLVFICKESVWKMTEKKHPKLARALSRPVRFVREKCFGIEPNQTENVIQLTEQTKLTGPSQFEESRVNVKQI